MLFTSILYILFIIFVSFYKFNSPLFYYLLAAHRDEGSNMHAIYKRAAASAPVVSDFGEQHSYEAAKMIHDSVTANHILHYTSIAILAVFVIEVRAKLPVIGCIVSR